MLLNHLEISIRGRQVFDLVPQTFSLGYQSLPVAGNGSVGLFVGETDEFQLLRGRQGGESARADESIREGGGGWRE